MTTEQLQRLDSNAAQRIETWIEQKRELCVTRTFSHDRHGVPMTFQIADRVSLPIVRHKRASRAWLIGVVLLWGSVSLMSAGCSVVAEYPTYIVRATDHSLATREFVDPPLFLGNGVRPSSAASRYGSVMFSTDDVCVLVYETEISSYRILWAGPFGCPCFPVRLFNGYPERSDEFSLAIVFVSRDRGKYICF